MRGSSSDKIFKNVFIYFPLSFRGNFILFFTLLIDLYCTLGDSNHLLDFSAVSWVAISLGFFKDRYGANTISLNACMQAGWGGGRGGGKKCSWSINVQFRSLKNRNDTKMCSFNWVSFCVVIGKAALKHN